MEQSPPPVRSELRSELRGILPFWSGIVLGALLGFLGAELAGQLTQPPLAIIPPTQTIVKEKTIMPAWMRDGKILTTADGTAVIVCDDCPCGEVELIETPCCENPIRSVLTASLLYTPSPSNPNPDCCMSTEQQMQLTRQAPDPEENGLVTPPAEIWQGTASLGCGHDVTVQAWCREDLEERWVVIVWCGETRMMAEVGVIAECEPFEMNSRDSANSVNLCCPGSGILEVIITE